jgi:hypothetical protein
MRELAGRVRKRFPAHAAHLHISDAANALDMGLLDGPIRHLRAAMHTLSPLELHRAGIRNDAPAGQHSNVPEADRDYAAATRFADEAHRHLLAVRDMKGDAPREASSGQYLAGGVRQYANDGAGGKTIELARAVRRQAVDL